MDQLFEDEGADKRCLVVLKNQRLYKYLQLETGNFGDDLTQRDQARDAGSGRFRVLLALMSQTRVTWDLHTIDVLQSSRRILEHQKCI